MKIMKVLDYLLTNSTGTVNNAAGYKAGVDTVAVDDGSNFTLYDSLYNSNKRFVGIITAIAGNNLSFNNLTHVPLTNGEKLFIVGSSIRTDVFSGDVSDEETLQLRLIMETIIQIVVL